MTEQKPFLASLGALAMSQDAQHLRSSQKRGSSPFRGALGEVLPHQKIASAAKTGVSGRAARRCRQDLGTGHLHENLIHALPQQIFGCEAEGPPTTRHYICIVHMQLLEEFADQP